MAQENPIDPAFPGDSNAPDDATCVYVFDDSTNQWRRVSETSYDCPATQPGPTPTGVKTVKISCKTGQLITDPVGGVN